MTGASFSTKRVVLPADVVARWLEEDCETTEFRGLRLVISEVLLARVRKYSPEYAAEFAEAVEGQVIRSLEDRSEEYRRDGVSPGFEIQVDGADAYFKTKCSPEKTFVEKLRAMSPAGFEVFCSDILQALSGQAVVEGKPADGGVDFYAFDLAPGGEKGPAPYASRIWIIGQSKRYQLRNDITEKQLREFVGGALRKLDELRERHPGRYGILTPVLFAFWTTSDFDRNAKSYARHMGLWYLNGVGLAQLALRVGLTDAQITVCEERVPPVRRRADQDAN